MMKVDATADHARGPTAANENETFSRRSMPPSGRGRLSLRGYCEKLFPLFPAILHTPRRTNPSRNLSNIFSKTSIHLDKKSEIHTNLLIPQCFEGL